MDSYKIHKPMSKPKFIEPPESCTNWSQKEWNIFHMAALESDFPDNKDNLAKWTWDFHNQVNEKLTGDSYLSYEEACKLIGK
jgi:hypothetical protein